MTLYTLESINWDIARFLELPVIYNDPYYLFFQYLHIWGIRFNELLNCKNWIYTPDISYEIPLSKGQNTRLLTNNDALISTVYYNFINTNYFNYINRSTANILIARYFPHHAFLDTGKSLGTYIFRHAYIKNLSASGSTPNEIAAIMGEINTANITGYINSQIYY